MMYKNQLLPKDADFDDIYQSSADSNKHSQLDKKYRAWAEVDLNALCHNAKALKELLPAQCNIMPVLKANAYGHSDIKAARALNKIGIYIFGVATLQEGIRLRKNGIEGEILILGYTSPEMCELLCAYQLTQTVVNLNHAKALNNKGIKIKVHIKIDTGMHRLGIDYKDITQVESIFNCSNLKVDGFFSHLSASDSIAADDILYTKMQIKQFFYIVYHLQSKGYKTGKLHIQASYGILNYPNLPCDYARAGIALYGVLSSNVKTRLYADLHPVLSLRARVSEIKHIAAEEYIGYGRQYIAKQNMKTAAVTIGYADGVPRNLSDDFYVLIRGKKALLSGRICMDQLIVNVTDIADAKEGDIVTIIGKDGDEQIRCEDLAQKCGTITNEILSRLSGRLNYIYL